MGKDEVYAVIREKHPDFTMKYYTNTILTQENLEKYGIDVLVTLASTVDWETRIMLQDGWDSGETIPEGLENKVRQENVSVLSQEMQDFIQNRDGILQDYAYFLQNTMEDRYWGLSGYWRPSEHIKILQHVKANGAMENYKKVEKLVQKESYLQFEPTSCLLLTDTAMQLFDGETIARLSNEIQSVVQNQHEKISIEEFDSLFKERLEKLAVLFSVNFQDRIFGRSYPPKQRQKITSEEVDALYKEYCEIMTKFPQELLKVLHLTSDMKVYDELVRANREGFLKDSSMIENWNKLREQMPSFVPLRWYLLSNEFIRKYSVQELASFSEDDILIKRLDKHGVTLFRLLKIEDIQKQEEEREDTDFSIDPMDEIFGGYYEHDEQEEYSLVKFAEDLLDNEQINKLVSYFRDSKKGPCLGELVEKLYARYKSVAQNNHNLLTTESLSEIEEIFRKAKKFEEVARFIPALHVLLKYPEEQIEKFDRKRWAGLVKYNLYSEDNNSKWALIEAILSLGVFEKDEDSKKRYGLLQKFATYIPKEIDVNSDILRWYFNRSAAESRDKKLLFDENFELVSEENIEESLRYVLREKRLMNDPMFVKMFGDKETAERTLLNWQLLHSMSASQMENALQGMENQDEDLSIQGARKIMQYIYQKGYEKEYERNYHFRLKSDLQQLDLKARAQVENKIRDIYKSLEIAGMMTKEKMHRIFDGMDMQYKPGFYEFFVNNLGTILSSQSKQGMLANIQRQWEKIEEAYLGQKITFDMCESYMSAVQYENSQKDLEIAKLSLNCGYDQSKFDRAVELYHKQLERTKSSIPAIQESTSAKKTYTYQVLKLDDPTAIFVGELTDCCQAIGDAGESCMIHSITSPNGRVLVVKDANGKVVSQSWIWRNKNVLCFDNVEAVERESNHKRVVSNEILNTIQRAAEEFVRVDKEHFEEWKQTKLAELTEQRNQGIISEQEFETEKLKIEQIVTSQRLTKVTVGKGYSDISLKGLKPDKENRYPEETVAYIADSRTQFILYEDLEAKGTKQTMSTTPTIALYSDGEELQKLINIDTSEIETESGENGWNIDDEWTEDDLFEDIYDADFVLAKEEVERFVRRFMNNTTRQEAQEFLAEIIHSLEREQTSK